MRRLLAVAALLGSIASLAQPAADPLAAFRFFVGEWEGQISMNGGAPVKVRYTLRPSLKGRWIKGHGDFAALGVEVEDFWGVDAQSGRLVRAVFDSNGVNGQVFSSGWNKDRLLWEGTVYVAGKGAQVRETITRTGPNAFSAVWEQRNADGTWTAYSRESFTRVTK